MSTSVNNSDRVIAAFERGTELTAKQITARYGVKNPRALVSGLRMKGYSNYLNKRTNGFGETYSKYRLGTPTRAVVAAGFQALATS